MRRPSTLKERFAGLATALIEAGLWEQPTEHEVSADPAQSVPVKADQDAARYQYWKNWWMHSETDTEQLPPDVCELLDDLDLDAAFDTVMQAKEVKS